MSPRILSILFSVLTAGTIALAVQYHLHDRNTDPAPRKFIFLNERVLEPSSTAAGSNSSIRSSSYANNSTSGRY